ncbi:MAG: hypothetical protein IPF92_19170 [Myxococcales bacterium]|jgi:hypothetical protein|nr:hypothetical protein [Myxococcales bacterium]MBL0194300.1 hypothetical protein [Myxococcales bacterium]HQY62761.1 TRL domain-containing protein [Polyangiaceae bacterium]
MNKLGLFACGSILAVVVGCGAGYPNGSAYNGSTIPHGMARNETAGAAKTGAKNGEACVSGVLGIASWGDGSLGAAKKAAGVTDVHSVEFHGTNILGIWQQGCTVVNGN